MPLQGILEALGVGAIFLLVLSPFWKGDDMISTTFRDDVSKWLINLNFNKSKLLANEVVLSLFKRVYGDRHFSFKCIMRCSIISFLLTLFLVLAFGAVIKRQLLATHISLLDIWLHLLAFLIINLLVDYVSLYISRAYIASKPPRRSQLGSFFLYVFYFSAWLMLAFLVVMIAMTTIEFDYEGYDELLLNFWYPHGFDLAFVLARVMACTALISFLWVVMVIVGGAFIRNLPRVRTLYSVATYVLPIDDRPIRSIGIAFTILSATCFGVTRLLDFLFSNVSV